MAAAGTKEAEVYHAPPVVKSFAGGAKQGVAASFSISA